MKPRKSRDELEAARGAMPLAAFPSHQRERILELAGAPKAPPATIGFGCAPGGGPLVVIPSRAWYEWHWARGIDPDARRDRIDALTRQRVIERDGYVCGLCGGDVEPNDVHIDHIVPWSLGGREDLPNLQVTHSKCNLRKGNRV